MCAHPVVAYVYDKSKAVYDILLSISPTVAGKLACCAYLIVCVPFLAKLFGADPPYTDGGGGKEARQALLYYVQLCHIHMTSLEV